MNRPHEVDSKVPQLRPQLRPQLPNPEIGNFKLRLQVAGVEAKLRHELRSSWRSLKHPNDSHITFKKNKIGKKVQFM